MATRETDAGVGYDDEVRLALEVRADLGRDGAVEAQLAPTAEERLTAVNEDGAVITTNDGALARESVVAESECSGGGSRQLEKARSTDKSLRLEKARDDIKSRQLEKASSPDGGAPAAVSTRLFTRAVKRRLEAAKAPVVTTVEQQQSTEEATVRSDSGERRGQWRVRFDLLGPDGTAKRPRTTAVVIERERNDGGRLEPTAVTARRRPARADDVRAEEATRMSSVTRYGAPMVFKSPR
ncbi:hypothetical protein GN958_ATG17340 [Phytophthora infestans]|uniref:Uncharacterized protein n=1 Tax=Phytophthora infestans TaxID=4787 RepID=A0A8S9U5I0_PHYIN|nr:hypothetical protein GN958_ATG17340 [Phytophthora infestans]